MRSVAISCNVLKIFLFIPKNFREYQNNKLTRKYAIGVDQWISSDFRYLSRVFESQVWLFPNSSRNFALFWVQPINHLKRRDGRSKIMSWKVNSVSANYISWFTSLKYQRNRKINALLLKFNIKSPNHLFVERLNQRLILSVQSLSFFGTNKL